MAYSDTDILAQNDDVRYWDCLSSTVDRGNMKQQRIATLALHF